MLTPGENLLPDYAGGKTSGFLARPDASEVGLQSGYDGPTRGTSGIPGLHSRIKSHVEAHAAVLMRREGLTWATHFINRVPCPTDDPRSPSCEALAALPRLVSPPNSIASLISPTGETLSIGIAGASDTDNPNLGSPLASIEYIPTDLSPPYRLVVGDPDLSFDRGDGGVFRFEGQWTEILRRNCVPVGTMIRVVEDFQLSGRLPDWIAWEDA